MKNRLRPVDLKRMTEASIIAGCRNDDRRAQKVLYEKYSPLLFAVCRRYVKNREDAEDVFVNGMYTIMRKIDQFKGEGSFEGWMRRIMVNQALMFLRKKNNFRMSIEISNVDLPTKVTVLDDLAAADILDLLSYLPIGYRTVFNLYVIEGYKHREIAEILGISINTSKSQLILAKNKLQSLVKSQKLSDAP